MYIFGFHIPLTSYEKTGQPVSAKATSAPKKSATKEALASRPRVQPRLNTPLNQTVVLSSAESERVRQEAEATVPRVLVKKGGGIDQLTDRGVPLSDPEILKLLGEAPTEVIKKDDKPLEDSARTKLSDTTIDRLDSPTKPEIPITLPSKSRVIKAGTHGKGKIEKTREDTSKAAADALDAMLNRRPKSKGK